MWSGAGALRDFPFSQFNGSRSRTHGVRNRVALERDDTPALFRLRHCNRTFRNPSNVRAAIDEPAGGDGPTDPRDRAAASSHDIR